MAEIGRPPAFKTAQDMQEAIDEFILDEDKKVTISGLCYHLGFESRQSFYDYEKKSDFTYTIKRARLFIESYYEGKLTNQSCTGSIFALKSMGWNDGSKDDANESLAKSVSDLINKLPD